MHKFDGEPWFRNNVVAKIQVYARSNNAIIDKVLVKSNSHSMLYWIAPEASIHPPPHPTLKSQPAESFTYWVCSTYTRTTGAYTPNAEGSTYICLMIHRVCTIFEWQAARKHNSHYEFWIVSTLHILQCVNKCRIVKEAHSTPYYNI